MKLNCLEQDTASIMIFRMMCQLGEKQGSKYDLRELFKMGEGNNDVDIKITVNGVEVDPIKCLESCWEQLDSAFENNVKEAAKKMISMAGFEELQEKIERFQWELENSLDEAFDKIKENK